MDSVKSRALAPNKILCAVFFVFAAICMAFFAPAVNERVCAYIMASYPAIKDFAGGWNWSQLVFGVAFCGTVSCLAAAFVCFFWNGLFERLRLFEKQNFFAFFIFLGFCLSCIFVCATNGVAWLCALHQDPKDSFVDLFGEIYSYRRQQYLDHIWLYPPLAIFICRALSLAIPDFVWKPELGYKGNASLLASSIYGSQLLILHFIVFVFLFGLLSRAFCKEKKLNSFLVFASLIFSLPMLFAFERGNIIIYVVLLACVFLHYKDSKNAAVRELSLASLAVAANIKYYVAVFGLTLLVQKRWKEAIRSFAYGAAIFFCCSLFFDDGLGELKNTFNYGLVFLNSSQSIEAGAGLDLDEQIAIDEWYKKHPEYLEQAKAQEEAARLEAEARQQEEAALLAEEAARADNPPQVAEAANLGNAAPLLEPAPEQAAQASAVQEPEPVEPPKAMGNGLNYSMRNFCDLLQQVVGKLSGSAAFEKLWSRLHLTLLFTLCSMFCGIFSCVFCKKNWQKYFACAATFILICGRGSATYILLFLIPALMEFFADEEKDYFALALFTVMFTLFAVPVALLPGNLYLVTFSFVVTALAFLIFCGYLFVQACLAFSEKCAFAAQIFQFVKFGIVGFFNTFISYGIYSVMLLAGAHYVLASVLGFVVSVLNSFFMNSRFVFKKGEGQKRNPFWTLAKTFASYSATGLFLQNILLVLLVEKLNVSQFVAPLMILLVTIPLNFVMNKFWAFRTSKEK